MAKKAALSPGFHTLEDYRQMIDRGESFFLGTGPGKRLISRKEDLPADEGEMAEFLLQPDLMEQNADTLEAQAEELRKRAERQRKGAQDLRTRQEKFEAEAKAEAKRTEAEEKKGQKAEEPPHYPHAKK